MEMLRKYRFRCDFHQKKIIFSREHFKSRYEVALLLLYKSRMHYIPTLDRLDQQKCEGKNVQTINRL